MTLLLVLFGSTPFILAEAIESSPSAAAGSNVTATLVSAPRALLQRASDRGISFQGSAIYDWSKALENGEDTDHGFARYSLDWSMTADGRKLFGLEGSTGFVRLKNHTNHFGQTYDGAAQLYSNIDASPRTTLYELWIEQRLFSNKLRFKAGKIDANSEFAAVQSAADFLNSSMGFSPTILNFPTYPEPKIGINAFLHPATSYGISLGAFQTTGMGTLLIAEGGLTWNDGQSGEPGRASLGYWHENGTMPRPDGKLASGAQGIYPVVEQCLWRHAFADGGERRLVGFLQIGDAKGEMVSITKHVGGGGVLQAPLRARGQDSTGIAATWVRFSSQPGRDFDFKGELVFEAYYKASINKHAALVPDFQYLHHPGGLRTNRDCPVITPRLVITF